jgi:hypothetical protein
MSVNYFRGLTEWALMVALVFGAGAAVRAQNQDNEIANEGVVKIGRPDAEQGRPNLPPPGPGDRAAQDDRGRQEMPSFWIGLRGGNISADHPLRAHLDLPERQGLLVADIVPNGPAAKAGLKQHDILLKANKTDLRDMKDLIEIVKTEGPKKGQITLEILRHNKRETVYLTPEKTPADAPVAMGGGAGGVRGEFAPGMRGNPGIPEDLLQQFQNRFPLQFRDFGNGILLGDDGQGVVGNLANGVSISIMKEGDKPVHVTVKRGDKTWNIEGDDPEALKQLPEDLRPQVEQMLHGSGGMRFRMPAFRQPGQPAGQPSANPLMDNGRLRDRLDRMEQRLEDLQKRLKEKNNPPAEKPNTERDQTK